MDVNQRLPKGEKLLLFRVFGGICTFLKIRLFLKPSCHPWDPGGGGATPRVLGRQLPPPPPQGASGQLIVVKGIDQLIDTILTKEKVRIHGGNFDFEVAIFDQSF